MQVQSSLSSSSISGTITEQIQIPSSSATETEKVLILKLKAIESINIQEKKTNRIRWSQDTINNEFMRKKSSKKCCIFHKTKRFGESDSDESDSDFEKDESSFKNKEEKLKNMQRFHA